MIHRRGSALLVIPVLMPQATRHERSVGAGTGRARSGRCSGALRRRHDRHHAGTDDDAAAAG